MLIVKNELKQNIPKNFTAGFTNKMRMDAMQCDVSKISADLQKMGIANDFKDNRIIAWCISKCVNIVNEINNRYNLQLGLPAGIIVEDFKLLKTNGDAFAFCNFAPAKLYHNKDNVTQGKVIFINQFKDYSYKKGNKFWENIDNISDMEYAEKNAPTDFFLNIFLHEFGHIMHEANMLNKIGGYAMISKLNKVLTIESLAQYRNRYQTLLSKICDYSVQSSLETVACDISKRVVENLDCNLLEPNSNFVKNSPYTTNHFSAIFRLWKNPYGKLLKNIWDGNF